MNFDDENAILPAQITVIRGNEAKNAKLTIREKFLVKFVKLLKLSLIPVPGSNIIIFSLKLGIYAICLLTRWQNIFIIVVNIRRSMCDT